MRVNTIITSTLISFLVFLGTLQTAEAKTQSTLLADLSTEVSNFLKGKIIEIPDIDPMYTGGSHELTRFISNNLRYPREAAEKDIQGLVVYNFVVELDGSLSNFEIIHRAHPLLDEEALRIIK